MRKMLSLGLILAAALSGPAIAQAPSSGEVSDVFACFFECKPGPVVRGIPTWQETTSLMVMNMNSGFDASGNVVLDDARTLHVVFLDGNQRILAAARSSAALDLPAEDLDEIHVCRTLEASGLPVPEAGIVEFYVAQGQSGGVYAWVKNLLGKFFVTADEPFDGRVSAIAKTECRQVPPEVSTPAEIDAKVSVSGAPNIPLILVENTEDVPPEQCNDNSECLGSEWCAKHAGDCGGVGECRLVPEVCITLFDPVCGCDGIGYSNSCVAAAARANVNVPAPSNDPSQCSVVPVP